MFANEWASTANGFQSFRQIALRAAPRFYQKNHRGGAAVAMTTRLCFVSRVAAGVTAIASILLCTYQF
jgi:hypothetical protein